MSDNTGKQVIYKSLIEQHRQIRIPMIQRDYAQGRDSDSVRDVRELFLSELESALKVPLPDWEGPMNLDFIYGTVEGTGDDTRFSPLDGQQRLTTLFLLHWYLAWNDNRFEDFAELFQNGEHSRFTYRVRPSSNQFFDRLVCFEPSVQPSQLDSSAGLSDLIANQSWYFRNWRLDPTILSALVMLDAIHNHFKNTSGLYERLIDEDKPAITFQLLDLDKFDLTDDLYIKMNARGMPLTPFENFKARYEQVLKGQFSGKKRAIENGEFPIHDFVARRLDTTWLDLFWSELEDSDKRAAQVDDCILNLFRVIALLTRNPDVESCAPDVMMLTKTLPNYSTFQEREWLDDAFTETLVPLLESWTKNAADGFQALLPNKNYFDEETIFFKITRNPLSLDVPELLLFMGYAYFIREHESELDVTKLQDWMRVLHNLVINSNVDRAERMPGGMRAILTLLPEADSILSYLAGSDVIDSISSFAKQQVKEESIKAALILSKGNWRPLIDKAELHGYFKGQIDFLLSFSGLLKKRVEQPIEQWELAAHQELHTQFQDCLDKAEVMFDGKGLKGVGQCRWERALLTLGNYMMPMGRQNLSFLVNASNEPYSWKRMLRGYTEIEEASRTILQELWNALDSTTPIGKQLDELISNSSVDERWRQELIKTPSAIDYCGKRAIRKNSDTEIYLLAKSQMNGAHAELFTYCLYQNLFRKLLQQGKLTPLTLHEYHELSHADFPPYFHLSFSKNDDVVWFNFSSSNNSFQVTSSEGDYENLEGTINRLKNVCKFQSNNGFLRKSLRPNEVDSFLSELAQTLSDV